MVRLCRTPAPGQLLPILVERLKSGTDLRRAGGGGRAANARTFGGEDYVGFHTIDGTSFRPTTMAAELPASRRACRCFKVLYRNGNRIHEHAATTRVLHPIGRRVGGNRAGFRVTSRFARRFAGKIPGGQNAFLASATQNSPPMPLTRSCWPSKYGLGQCYRMSAAPAWSCSTWSAREHAQTLLRQSVHYCSEHREERKIRRLQSPCPRVASPGGSTSASCFPNRSGAARPTTPRSRG